jgi:hypothetical protein
MIFFDKNSASRRTSQSDKVKEYLLRRKTPAESYQLTRLPSTTKF